MPATPKKCETCQYFYLPPEGDTIFPEHDEDIEGFCRVVPPRNRGGRVVVATMYPMVLKALPACGEYNKGKQNW